jgi:hypothetical protein
MHRLRYREQRGGERRELYMREVCLSPASCQLVSDLSIHTTDCVTFYSRMTF